MSDTRGAGAELAGRAALREGLVVYGLVSIGCVVVALLAKVVPSLSQYLYLGFPGLFLFVPTWLVWRRGQEYEDYGLVAEPYGKGLAYFVGLSLVVFPLFVLGYVFFYRLVCGLAARGVSLPRFYRRICRRFVGGWAGVRWPSLDRAFLERAASQLIVIALPEEYFFRGYLQTRLEQAWPPRRRFISGGVGLALVVTSLLFAVGHVIIDLRPLRLAVFFPSLLFGWLRGATGSILASVLFHACCNIAIELLDRSFF